MSETMTFTMQLGLNINVDSIYGAMMYGGTSTKDINNYNNENRYTVNQTNTYPRPLSRLKIYRQTQNELNI